ncbi:hypothetical protein DQ04_04501030 [Trypanosoma grayi]|uniref:hypothetical protein n=1 Tax=Trypanosoma grayi TaxID=71804 RepID=UPI0004F4489A|nr:hypothetical protein DQ04_04501030 [Trypanosoma grayi]KEG09877.1 hypothetical protein DQ04_04501030 [Trypanosoma grayi]
MLRLCLQRTRAAPCRSAVAAAICTPSRYRSVNEGESSTGINHGGRPAASSSSSSSPDEMPLRRGHVDRGSATIYPRVLVALKERQKEQQIEEQEKDGDTLSATNGSSAAAVDEFHPEGVADAKQNAVQAFLEAKKREVQLAQLERNLDIPYPTHPDDMVPEFRRIKRHQSQVVVAADPDYPVFERRDQFVQLPPPAMHPWVKNTPVGPFILHGDGQLGVAGTGEVGFDSTHATEALPQHFRGLRHRSVLQQRLPQKNGKVLHDAVVKNSFALTGRGVFATKDIAAGETIMIVQSTACSLGVRSEVERLVDMCSDVLLAVYEGATEDLEFLHDWVLTGQPSSLLEYWPTSATQQVLERIGGVDVLHALELHEVHIARLAAIMDMNSLLVESSYAVRKGMAYFPEAGFLNHSCTPNATYDVIPEHTFRDTDYYIDEVGEMAAVAETTEEQGSVGEKHTTAGASPPPTKQSGIRHVSHFGSSGIRYADGTNAAAEGVGYHELTTEGPGKYLFCCRATATIPAGTEILISYVPPDWSFDNRQYVLHDRYRFWCKCPKCAPTLDSKYARVPRLIVFMLLLSVFLQLLVVHQRDMEQTAVRNRASAADEEEHATEGGASDAGAGVTMKQRQKKRSHGLFEILEESRLQELYSPDRGPLPAPVYSDPWAQPPR